MQNSAKQIRQYLNMVTENVINSIHLPFNTVNFTVDDVSYPIVGWGNRAFVVVDINGTAMPFYLSSGEGGKATVAPGKWYPFFGVGSDGWLNKGSEDIIVKYYGSNFLQTICKKLDNIVGDIRHRINSLPAANYKVISSVANRDLTPVPYGNGAAAWNNINQTLVKINSEPLLIPYLNSQILLLNNNQIDKDKFNQNIENLIANHSRKKNLILSYLKKYVDISVFTKDSISPSDDQIFETWTKKYKKSINCKNPKGFSQRAHCAARKKRRAGGKTTSKPVRETLVRTTMLLEDIVNNLRSQGWSMLAIEDHLLARLNEKQILDENLRKWFKQKWVRFGPDGKIRGACARGSKGEGKPKCLPQAKAHALGKKGRASAARRKRREDPNPQRRGPAKNVATRKKVKEENTSALQSVQYAKKLLPKILEKVQKTYNDWDEGDIDTFAGGGICHFIADDICSVLSEHNIECTTVSCSHEQHVYVAGKFIEGIFSIDIPYSIYETGGGFSWKKIPNIKFEPADVVFYKVSGDVDDWDEYILTETSDDSSISYSTERKIIELPRRTKITKNGYKLDLYYDGSTVSVYLYPPEYNYDYSINYIAYAVLDRDGNNLFPIDLAVVDDQYKGRGIAKIMYDYLKDLGFKIYRGKDQTGAGKKFWNKNRGKHVNVWETNGKRITKPMIHRLADKLGIPWDNEPNFLKMTEKLTGKEHLDDLNQNELQIVYDHLKNRNLNEKQDACYYKVKSRYKVWPSAYASGALVQCRKKGAKNWGKGKK
jgi:predicted GNAT family acetyltransferase